MKKASRDPQEGKRNNISWRPAPSPFFNIGLRRRRSAVLGIRHAGFGKVAHTCRRRKPMQMSCCNCSSLLGLVNPGGHLNENFRSLHGDRPSGTSQGGGIRKQTRGSPQLLPCYTNGFTREIEEHTVRILDKRGRLDRRAVFQGRLGEQAFISNVVGLHKQQVGEGTKGAPNSARIDIVLETDKGHRGGQFASCCKSFKLDGGGKHKKEVSKAKIDLFGQGP